MMLFHLGLLVATRVQDVDTSDKFLSPPLNFYWHH
jgi:hypothetical protein